MTLRTIHYNLKYIMERFFGNNQPFLSPPTKTGSIVIAVQIDDNDAFPRLILSIKVAIVGGLICCH